MLLLLLHKTLDKNTFNKAKKYSTTYKGNQKLFPRCLPSELGSIQTFI